MNHRYLLTVLKLSLAAVIMTAIGASQASAQDSKVYPGLTCINRYNTGIPVYDESGTIGNSSTTDWLHVGCPIVRDGRSVTSAWVQVIDLNSAQDIECRIIRAFGFGTTVPTLWSYPRRSTGPDTVAWGSLEELELDGSPATYSHYLVSCIIPPMAEGVSKIVTYQATEN